MIVNQQSSAAGDLEVPKPSLTSEQSQERQILKSGATGWKFLLECKFLHNQ